MRHAHAVWADVRRSAVMHLVALLFSSTRFSKWQMSRRTSSWHEFALDNLLPVGFPLACRSRACRLRLSLRPSFAFARYATGS